MQTLENSNMKIRRTHSLAFIGYYRDEDKHSIGKHSGLYFVYRGVRNEDSKEKFTATLKELLYIGQAEDVNDRLNKEHEHYEDWSAKLGNGEILYYSTCEVEKKQFGSS